jgi:hypothetical protein
MPGRFPGRVVEVRRPDAVSADWRIHAEAVDAMIDRGMCALTGADDPRQAWQSFFRPDDVVGIKVNPVGRKPKPHEGDRVANAVGSISSPEVLLKIVAELKNVGVKPGNIIVFERYAQEFIDAGYANLMFERALDGVRWYASAARYHDQQVNIEGFDEPRSAFSPELVRHVVGYDPSHFVHMGFASQYHDPKDDRAFRTHCSMIVTRLVNKIITIPVLKDHRSAGVTLSLKNLSHGMNNNVARSHLAGFTHGGIVAGGQWLVASEDRSSLATSHWPLATISGPNQCNTFIPTAVSQRPIREKATLHIMDGLIGVYEGGPGNWNKTWGTWRHQGLLFATDPVALDHVGWDIINAKRAAMGWAPVEEMGLLGQTPQKTIPRHLATLAAKTGPEALALRVPAQIRQGGLASESFDRRQPEHIILAGTLGLGVFARERITHQLIEMTA